MITQSSLYQVNQDMNQSLEKLSTGLRINRASDDAAGLGVSENLRTQVNGTAQATKNAQDGIAALNVAEGAANEVSSILQRMRELAVQSSNDTLTSTERSYTDSEFQRIRSRRLNKTNLAFGMFSKSPKNGNVLSEIEKGGERTHEKNSIGTGTGSELGVDYFGSDNLQL
jgi:flagellin